jgi:magnesium-dependent phosphatase-1
MIRLVVFDLDEVLWTMPRGYCALLTPPLTRQGDRLEDAAGLTLCLRPDARATLEALRERGFLLSAASRSRPKIAREVLRRLDLDAYFACPCLEWQDKDRSLERILADLEKERGARLRPEEVLFVDDWPENIEDAARLGVCGLLFGRDLLSLSQLLDYLDPSGDLRAVRSL